MRINQLTSFAAGLLIATTISGAVYFNTQSGEAKAAAQISENDIKNKLEAKGYVVQTKADYNKALEAVKPAASKQPDSKQSASQPASNQPAPKPAITKIIKAGKTVTQVTVNVSPGMTSFDVGKTLLQAGFVKSAFDFSQSIRYKGLEKNLRPGTYVVDSSMTYDQIVSTIFK